MNWKVVLILIVLIIGVFALSYTFRSAPMSPAIKVKVKIEGNMSSVVITDVDASLVNVSVVAVQKGDDVLRFPSVAINVIENKRPISYYRYLDYTGSGMYETDVGLVEPLKGDKVRVIVQIFESPDGRISGVKKDIFLNRTKEP